MIDFIIKLVSEFWLVFFCMYCTYSIEIIDWLAKKITKTT